MKRLYLTLLLWLIIPLAILMSSLHLLLHHLAPDDLTLEDRLNRLLVLIDQVAEDQGMEYAEALAYSVAELNFHQLERLSWDDPALPDDVRDQLSEGELQVWNYKLDQGYLTFGTREYVYLSREEHSIRTLNRVLLSLLFGCLVLCSLFWLLGLKVRIRKLEATTSAFAEGDFSARASTRLADSVGDLNKRFNTMADRIAALLSSHRQLTNAMAHELRTPLFRLKCQLEMLSEGNDTDIREQRIADMHEDLDELNDMANEILCHARLEREQLQPDPKPASLTQVMRRLQQKLGREAHDRHLSFDIPAEVWLPMNTQHIERALGNLLRNALRHSTSEVRVSVESTADQVLICVDDDGPGIPAEHRQRIFEPFVRLDKARNRDTGGHGLGLSIAHQIIALHGGTISAESSPLGGARFRIEWPLPAPPCSQNTIQ
ncbi:HAMP domain-containing protein [Natronospirillum operosum]|uniref:histidine kinase n=1 Tax=Natronospirillum operosum TaxID=2759953 RepID=A0A4Z0WAJ7_9GAMM|nr:ATP-binding protein [Natronospirillum operosum]TGG90716.1 HAMP domain-containing protein [Natronospirillum operosum]